MHAALHKPAAGNQGHKRCLRQTLAFTSLSARPVLVIASRPLLHMHTASSWLELPPFLPCTDFMPFKLCWQRTWLFLLTAAASSGPMLLFTEKPVFPKTSRASCCDARTVETVVKMCRGQSCWQPASVSVQVAYQIETGNTLGEDRATKYLVEGKDPLKTLPLCTKRRYMPSLGCAFSIN